MCRAVTCRRCGKTTWAGCGQHVSSVRATVPAGQWCSGHPDEGVPTHGDAGVPAERLLRRLFRVPTKGERET